MFGGIVKLYAFYVWEEDGVIIGGLGVRAETKYGKKKRKKNGCHPEPVEG